MTFLAGLHQSQYCSCKWKFLEDLVLTGSVCVPQIVLISDLRGYRGLTHSVIEHRQIVDVPMIIVA